MGQRASYVVVEGESIDLYYSHWGAPSIPEHLLAGPDGMLAYIRRLATSDKLLDDVWAEGAVLLDRDHRRLLFWGGEDIALAPHLRRGLLPILRLLWPGWRVAWATFGMADIARSLGLDPAVVLVSERGDNSPTTAEDLREEYIDGHVRDDYADYQGVAVTIRDPAGRAVDHLFAREHPASVGPALLEVCQSVPAVVLPREDTGFNALEGPTYIDEGVYLDFAARAMWIWSAEIVDPRRLEDTARRWPGWRVAAHSDGLARQVALSGRDPRMVLMPDTEVLRQLIDTLAIDRGFDPSGLLSRVLENPPSGEGVTAVVDPHFLDADPEGLPPDERRRVLNELAERVLPLPMTWVSSSP